MKKIRTKQKIQNVYKCVMNKKKKKLKILHCQMKNAKNDSCDHNTKAKWWRQTKEVKHTQKKMFC